METSELQEIYKICDAIQLKLSSLTLANKTKINLRKKKQKHNNYKLHISTVQ
ncbi:M-specific polypeptide Mi at silenced MAT2 locus [Schizosaccharomyces osmophilus]|uniref:M-specific polypeptide Mi at silenced MAT2 locus n=1 Tax=Schizosaccharomyces osmophilus TaxID=2545709 RepID=A0AAE9WAT1_9SCHI|nr:M-specific polypeptide Mi at silenced MAT2 locus [Schizosaccharomyces osmophilus]WBW71183.1 M-specific polypeptide Mi at silenced MAT2 locus [Schizosaccharomyces osmophilus]